MKGKNNNKPVLNTAVTATANKELAKLTREQLSARYEANVEERKRLSNENKALAQLWKEKSPVKAKKPVEKPTVKKTAAKKK
jgi:hypothetical protein